MRHVDDGTIHAWLDRQVSDPAEAAWIEAHLRECPVCSARLADEQATLQQADAVLSAVAPVADASRAAFDALVAKAATAGSRQTTDSRSTLRTWVMPVSWAATIALAVGLGWAIRDRAPELTTPPTAVPAPVPAAPRLPASQAPDTSTSGVAMPPQPPPSVREAKGEVQAGQARDARSVPPRAESAAETAAPLAQTPAGQDAKPQQQLPAPPGVVGGVAAPPPQFRLSGSLGESEVGGSQQAPRPTQLPTPQQASSQQTAPAPVAAPPAPAATRPPPPPPSPAPAQTADAANAQEITFTLNAAQEDLKRAGSATEARGAAPAPAAGAGAAPPATGAAGGRPAGGGGGGAGGGRGGGGGARGGGRAVPSPLADTSGWIPLPRTEAAARSGMALYGIDGLMPLATMVSADASAVRTMYRLETGEIVELVQEKAGAVEAARGNVAPTATANQGQAAQAQTGQIQGQGQGQGQAQTAQPPQPWTAVRDNVRLTLRGGGNLAALGERLRPE